MHSLSSEVCFLCPFLHWTSLATQFCKQPYLFVLPAYCLSYLNISITLNFISYFFFKHDPSLITISIRNSLHGHPAASVSVTSHYLVFFLSLSTQIFLPIHSFFSSELHLFVVLLITCQKSCLP